MLAGLQGHLSRETCVGKDESIDESIDLAASNMREQQVGID